eukprot:3331663-Rhodomonas_salina.1
MRQSTSDFGCAVENRPPLRRFFFSISYEPGPGVFAARLRIQSTSETSRDWLILPPRSLYVLSTEYAPGPGTCDERKIRHSMSVFGAAVENLPPIVCAVRTS